MPPARHAAPDRSVRYLAAAIAAVLLTALGVLSSASAAPGGARPVGVASLRLTSQAEPRVVHPAPVTGSAAAPELEPRARTTRLPARTSVRRPVPARRPARPAARWLPTGTGMWLHDYTATLHGNGRAIVAHARLVGLSHLFVHTGSSHDGWIGTPALRSLLPAAKQGGVSVIAWDFADLKNPVADARRLASAALFRCTGCARVRAVAPDIETAAEGTRISGANVVRYYRELRRWLPSDVAILATVPWPSEMRVGRYPYVATAQLVDALVPMAYWYNRSPAQVTATSIQYLRRFHRPVMPVGQGYDGRIDAPYLAPDPHPELSVASFLQTAHHNGARSVSLWSWDTTGVGQWRALAKGRGLFAR